MKHSLRIGINGTTSPTIRPKNYDLDVAAETLGERLEREVRVSAMAQERRVPYDVSNRRASR